MSADDGHMAASKGGDSAPQEQPAAANGNGHSFAEGEHEEVSGDEGPQEDGGEETEISDYDEPTHDGEPASSGGAGTGSGLRPSYGRKVRTPRTLVQLSSTCWQSLPHAIGEAWALAPACSMPESCCQPVSAQCVHFTEAQLRLIWL